MTIPPLPTDFTLEWFAPTKAYADGAVLVGGSPLRMLRLAATGVPVVESWRAGRPVGKHGTLARRLTQVGVFEPVPPHGYDLSVTVVIPVFNNPTGLAACLDGLPYPAIVVDDGSNPVAARAIAEVCRRRSVQLDSRHGVELIRRDTNEGPAAARNVGWRMATTDLVLFLDSDASCPASTGQRLVDHFADEYVVAVAPRITAAVPNHSTVVARHESRHSSLNLGSRSASVKPLTRVAYVPSTCLMARRSALENVIGFDENLRFGEDVDLVWRLSQIGSIRYDAAITAEHQHPSTIGDLIKRRIGYGSSAAPLDRRHPGWVAPTNCSPYTAGAWMAMAAGHPIVGLATMVGSAAALPKKLTAIPKQDAFKLALTGHLKAWKMFTSATRRTWLPIALMACIRSAKARRWLVFSLATVSPLQSIDDASYCVGVWRGCWHERSIRALMPKISRWPPRPDQPSTATK